MADDALGSAQKTGSSMNSESNDAALAPQRKGRLERFGIALALAALAVAIPASTLISSGVSAWRDHQRFRMAAGQYLIEHADELDPCRAQGEYVVQGTLAMVSGFEDMFASVYDDMARRSITCSLSQTGEAVDPSDVDNALRYTLLSSLPPEPPAMRRGGRTTLYVQFAGDADRARIGALRETLQDDYNVPGMERVAGSPFEIRYYHPEQLHEAAEARGRVAIALGISEDSISLLDLSSSFPNLPRGLMEVWVGVLPANASESPPNSQDRG